MKKNNVLRLILDFTIAALLLLEMNYDFNLEGTLYWSSNVLFSGSFTVGGGSVNTIQIVEKYTQNTKTNRGMITSITATYMVD